MTYNDPKLVSIIIPSYNSDQTIEKCLDALYNQTYKGDYEIILADSSDDTTKHIVQQKFPLVNLITFEKKTDPGTARNAAIKESRGELLLLIDSDCVAEKDWIEQIVICHLNNSYAAIGGSVFNGNNPNNNVAWAGYMAEFREFLPGSPKRKVNHIPTCNISYKRNIFDNLSFNPKYYPQEDLEFNFKVIQHGGEILFDPGIKIFHHHRETLSSFLKHQLKVGTITSKMLKILPLEGSTIVRYKILVFLSFWILPCVKFFRTIIVFAKIEPEILFKHFISIFIFGLGLIPWTYGFIKGTLTIPE